MMTPTHLLMASALLAHPGRKRRNTAIIAGALLPDLVIYILVVYAVVSGIPQSTLWTETYWHQDWQVWVTIGNSVPLYLALLLLALILAAPTDGRPRWQSLPALLALAALVHLAGDLPVHNDDAHSHLWPLTDWRFHSPVSYWDTDHYGGFFAPLEASAGLLFAGLLFRRFEHRPVRIGLVILGVGYLALIAIALFAT